MDIKILITDTMLYGYIYHKSHINNCCEFAYIRKLKKLDIKGWNKK
jgi:hypothetical protein